MMRRYRMMADAGVRDLESYNKQARMSADDELEPMPQIVVVIDELADLMLVAAKEVEESICRIAQMGRASGIHLVIATQRPSADVITGLMKANIPSRIAFAVAFRDGIAHHSRYRGRGKARRQGRHALCAARPGQAQARAGLLHHGQ
ncbi:MAG: FtsK/SpoIIIE domain-containing protein [Oscillospiraceae bacterium]